MSKSAAIPPPPAGMRPAPLEFRARMAFRWARFALHSALRGDLDFVRAALGAEIRLVGLAARDALGAGEQPRRCNVCGWSGRSFYPNVGPGYDESGTTCPGCGVLDRHRSLHAVLATQTRMFQAGTRIVEVAPARGFQAHCLARGDLDYTSFDVERFALERGDLLDMSYPTDTVDFFLCFHVLEHIREEARAVQEIRRVLKPSGELVIQVPVDWDEETTIEYGAPDPRDANHVRRYGRDFGSRLESLGFHPVRSFSVEDLLPPQVVAEYALCPEPVFVARNP